ncbi:RICIN domain-containing protein [Paraglaciecola sp. L3A3]|uniref:RICIN domain-containing protein n=1 Tax=Paraglaciecola sp. L3A3 TaxID=2686358 RepID=UPI00131E9E26|nr:RICIN domain-containing protein [Paraglaciecola sp. L3A3]
MLNTKMYMKSCAIFCFLLLSLLSIPLYATSYYVSPTGSDTASGDESHPFATIVKARDTVRTINQNMTADITIVLREGTHTLDNTLTFYEQDSGSNGYNIIYKNYPGEIPIISSGIAVSSWQLHDSSKGIYKAYVGTNFYSRHLFVNGVRAKRAQSSSSQISGFTLNAAEGFNAPSTGTFSSMSSWGNITDIEIRQRKVWTMQWGAVESVTGNVITLKDDFWRATRHYAQWGIGMDSIDAIENAYELLDEEGEWYLDRSSGYLYYKPLASQTNLNNLTFTLPSLEKLIEGNLAGSATKLIENIKFEGLTFSYTTSLQPLEDAGRVGHQAGVLFYKNSSLAEYEDLSASAVHFKYARHITFQNCTFNKLGTSGLAFDIGSQHNLVTGNTFADISSNGISIGNINLATNYNPVNPEDRVTHNTISDNVISLVGQEMTDSVGIFGGYVNNLIVAHNTLFDLPYTPISVGWGWGGPEETNTYNPDAVGSNSITSNRIYNYMNVNLDGGGIYTLGRQDNSSIKFNYINGQKNVYTYIYLDNGSEYISVEDNVISSEGGSIGEWLMATNDVNEVAYYASNFNLIRNNYYSRELNIFRCYYSNVCGLNIAVENNNWPDRAVDIINNAGVNMDAVTTPQANVFQIYGKTSQMVFAPQNHSNTAGTPLVQMTNTNTDEQKWELIPVDERYYLLKNIESGLVVVPQNQSTVAGAPLILASYTNHHSQHWELYFSETTNSSGVTVLKNRASNFVVTPSNYAAATDTTLIQYTNSNNSAQVWMIGQQAPQSSVTSDFHQIVGSSSQMMFTPSSSVAAMGVALYNKLF